MAPMTWARTLEVEVADLPVVLDHVVACSSTPPLEVSSSSSSCLRAEGAPTVLECFFFCGRLSTWFHSEWYHGDQNVKNNFSHCCKVAVLNNNATAVCTCFTVLAGQNDGNYNLIVLHD